jgi:hypothetical protein
MIKKIKLNLLIKYIMEFDIKYSIFFYLIILLLIYLWKPSIFNLNTENKRRKYILLLSLIIIVAIICMYIKIFFESM